MTGSVGYIDYQNKLHFYNQADAQTYGNYTIGNSGIKVSEALAGKDLSAWNKSLSYDWSFSNLLKNAGNLDANFTKYAIIGAVTLVALAVLK